MDYNWTEESDMLMRQQEIGSQRSYKARIDKNKTDKDAYKGTRPKCHGQGLHHGGLSAKKIVAHHAPFINDGTE